MRAQLRRLTICLLLLTGTLTAACGGGDSDGAAPTAPSQTAVATANDVEIAGRVYDEQARRGLDGLAMNWSTGEGTFTTFTGQDGAYSIRLPRADVYSVSAWRVGDAFPTLSGGVRPTGPSDLVNFFVNTGGCPTEYGRVIDATTRRPISGAQVEWVGVTATSDGAGNYRLVLECNRGYGSNTTVLTVSHPNYLPVRRIGGRAESLGHNPGESRSDYALTAK